MSPAGVLHIDDAPQQTLVTYYLYKRGREREREREREGEREMQP